MKRQALITNIGLQGFQNSSGLVSIKDAWSREQHPSWGIVVEDETDQRTRGKKISELKKLGLFSLEQHELKTVFRNIPSEKKVINCLQNEYLA